MQTIHIKSQALFILGGKKKEIESVICCSCDSAFRINAAVSFDSNNSFNLLNGYDKISRRQVLTLVMLNK